MAHKIEGNDTIGYRVIDDNAGALTGRKKTVEDALAAAGIGSERKLRGRPPKKAEEPDES